MDRIGPFVYRHHPPRVPPLHRGRDPRRHRVAIAGGGPVGLATALALARWGIASVVVEADTTVCVGSRAICVSRRSLEIVEQLGALGAFLDKGLPWHGGRTFHRLDTILQFTMPHDADQKLPPMINLQQYWIEQFLVDAAERQADLIELRWGTEAIGLQQRDDGVTLQLRCGDTDYALDAEWLVACDGGQSFVRRELGLKLEGTGFEGKYVIVDITLPSPHPTERRAWFDPPSNPGSTVLMHKQPDDLWRLDYQIPDEADLDRALQPQQVSRFVERHLQMIGEAGLPWRIEWISAYRAGAMTLERYRHGRIVFAGNAAHVLPIFGVRGLNSGIEDAFNLAWKLAAALHGWAAPALLDSYDAERRQAFRVNADAAIQSTEFMAPPSRGFSLMREAALTLAHRNPQIAQLANPRQTTAIAYDDSPLNADGDAGAAATAPGAPLADAPVRGPAASGHLSDLMGPFWTALVFAPDGAVEPRLDRELRRLESGPVPFRTVVVCRGGEPRADANRVRAVDADGRALAVYGKGVCLVRPDAHVAGRWSRPGAAQLRAALARAVDRDAIEAPDDR